MKSREDEITCNTLKTDASFPICKNQEASVLINLPVTKTPVNESKINRAVSCSIFPFRVLGFLYP
jgi:hypothetical protein